jgi:hypothetical protein
MVDASLVLDAIVAVSIAAGAVFAVLELRNLSNTRRTDLVVHLTSYVSSREFIADYLKILRAEFKDAKEAEEKCSEATLYSVGDFFETLGFLVRNKDVDSEPVRDLMGSMVTRMWDKMGPVVSARRKDFSPRMFHNFEYLANELRTSP